MLKKSIFVPKKYPKIPKMNKLKFYSFHAGFKKKNKDLMVVVFNEPATTSGVTTRSSIPSAPVVWNKKILKYGKCKVLLVNSGIANAFTGKKGMMSLMKNVKYASKKFNCKPQEVYISSTGLIGEFLDENKINNAIKKMDTSKQSEVIEAAKAIMTTDTFPKITLKTFKYNKEKINLFGIAKGSGMIAPNMATMLAYIFIDIPIKKNLLDKILLKSVENSFNSITVDSDTSTSDTVLLFAIKNNNLKKLNTFSDFRYNLISKKIHQVMEKLSKQIVMDGEGISKFIEINVKTAKTLLQAKTIAFAVGESPLVKTAVCGEDPNWGRIIAAIGKTQEEVDPVKIKIKLGKYLICSNGLISKRYKPQLIKKYMKNNKIQINIDLGLGKFSKKIWTTDLTKEYIKINSEYQT